MHRGSLDGVMLRTLTSEWQGGPVQSLVLVRVFLFATTLVPSTLVAMTRILYKLGAVFMRLSPWHIYMCVIANSKQFINMNH